MMNPFGLPDEVLEMLVKEAIKQQTASKKPTNPLNVDAVAMAKKSATSKVVKQHLQPQSSFMMPMWKLDLRRNRLLNWLRVS